MKTDAKCRTSGGLRYLGVTEVNGDSTIRYSAYEFPLAFHFIGLCPYLAPFVRYSDILGGKSPTLAIPDLRLATPSE